MKKEIIIVCAALALAGCSNEGNQGGTGTPSDTESGATNGGYNRPSTNNTITNKNSGGTGSQTETNKGSMRTNNAGGGGGQ